MVFNDYPILPGKRRSLSADLVVLNDAGSVKVAAELKHKPSHQRTDICRSELPVISWDKEGAQDVTRVHEFIDKKAAQVAYAIFIDGGGYFRHRPPHAGREWRDWPANQPGAFSPSVLWACAKANG